MIIENLRPFVGQHCETTATGTLLQQIGINLSEPVLFGLGEGLGFIFWNAKNMDYPFIGGRIKPDAITSNIAKNLNLELIAKETSSPEKAWGNVKVLIDQGQAVGLKLDCYHLEYFSRSFHFAAHYVAMYGYDENTAFLVDTCQQGTQVKTSLTSLALARAEKGPMSSKNLYYTLSLKNGKFDLEDCILRAIRNNAEEYLNPPITNIGYKGILKTGSELKKWFSKSQDIENEFGTAATLMEKGGTGGALFRNLYRDFLKESYDMLKLDKLNRAYLLFSEIAPTWSHLADLFNKTAETKDIIHIHKAAELMKDLSEKEKSAMEILASI